MIIRLCAAMTAVFFLCALVAAQTYHIRVAHNSNLRHTYSLDADVIETASAGATLQVVGRVNRWLKINRNGKELWMADWIDYTRVEDSAQPSSQTATIAQIDNCCFVDRQCQSDQDWTNGYHAFQNGQCAPPAQLQSGASPQPASSQAGPIDNCCFAGWICRTELEWAKGYYAYRDNQCATPSQSQTRQGPVDSCCQVGWNCTIEFDFVFGRGVIEDGFECGPPTVQTSVQGLIIEGTQTFIGQLTAALDLLRHRAPHWFAYVVTGAPKIRGGPYGPGTFAWYGAINIAPPHAEEDTITLAGTLLHESCHVQRERDGSGGSTHVYDTVAGFSIEENICEVIRVGALKEVDPSRPPNPWLEAALNRFFSNGGRFDFDGAANAQRQKALRLLSQLPTNATSPALVGNCCTAGWNCTHEQEWFNGYLAYQNNQCGGPPQIGSCCYAGWHCTFDFDWIMGKWVYSDNNMQCFSPRQEVVDGLIIEGSDAFIASTKSALNRIKSRSPQWYSYVVSGALKIRESPGNTGTGTLERSMNIKAGTSIAQLARDIVGWSCDLHRWLTRAELSGPEPETPAAVADCATVNLDALQSSFS